MRDFNPTQVTGRMIAAGIAAVVLLLLLGWLVLGKIDSSSPFQFDVVNESPNSVGLTIRLYKPTESKPFYRESITVAAGATRSRSIRADAEFDFEISTTKPTGISPCRCRIVRDAASQFAIDSFNPDVFRVDSKRIIPNR